MKNKGKKITDGSDRPSDSEILDWIEAQGSKHYGWEV